MTCHLQPSEYYIKRQKTVIYLHCVYINEKNKLNRKIIEQDCNATEHLEYFTELGLFSLEGGNAICATFFQRDIPSARHPFERHLICATFQLRDLPVARRSNCATFQLRDIPSARHPSCATFQLRDISIARHFNCATFQLRDISFARHPSCATTHLRDYFSSCLGPLLGSLG